MRELVRGIIAGVMVLVGVWLAVDTIVEKWRGEKK